MAEKRLQTLLNLGSLVLICMLIGSFAVVLRAAVSTH